MNKMLEIIIGLLIVIIIMLCFLVLKKEAQIDTQAIMVRIDSIQETNAWLLERSWSIEERITELKNKNIK